LSYSAIGAALTLQGVPTPAGRTVWRKSTVDRLLHAQYVRDLREESEAGLGEVVGE
jgi:hypothetical protein